MTSVTERWLTLFSLEQPTLRSSIPEWPWWQLQGAIHLHPHVLEGAGGLALDFKMMSLYEVQRDPYDLKSDELM